MEPEDRQDGRCRVFAVGLDGATFDLIVPWVEAGELPTFGRLMEQGCWGELESTIPPVTAPAWSSFATGKNPGKHGVFDFAARIPGRYETAPLDASAIRAVPFWQLLGGNDKRVVLLNIPVTYPPEPVNGLMVTGMLTPPHAACFTHPPSLGEELLEAVPGYEVWPEGVFHPKGREGELLEVVRSLSEARLRAAEYLMGRVDWDFFMVVFRATDIIQHWLWRFMEDPEGRPELGRGILDTYRHMDGILARLLEILPGGARLMLMSDHGAGPLDRYIHVNTWLLSEGYLMLKKGFSARGKRLVFRMGITPKTIYNALIRLGLGRDVGRAVRARKAGVRAMVERAFLSFRDVDWHRTRAYSYGNVGPLYINLKGREPAGAVEPGVPYERLCEELAERLMALRDPATGQPLIGRVYRKGEIYSGEALEAAPDLFFMPRDLRDQAFGLLHFSSHRWLEPSFDRTGAHRMNGMVLFWGEGIRAGSMSGAAIMDLAPTILAMLKTSIPKDMDGRVLEEVFQPEAFSRMRIRYTDTPSARRPGGEGWAPEDQEEVSRRLRNLGYI